MAQRQRGYDGTAKGEDDEHHLLDEAAVGAVDGEGGNGVIISEIMTFFLPA